MSWALIQLYSDLRTRDDKGQYRDECCGELAFQKSDSFHIVPAAAIRHHVRMVHMCRLDGVDGCDLSKSNAGKHRGAGWYWQCVRAAGSRERYLLNSYYYYRR